MNTQHCLQCEFHKDRIDQFGCKYCYCFFNPDRGRWVTEIEDCPKLEKQSDSLEIPNDLDEAAMNIARDVCKQLPNGEEKDGIVYYAILAAIAGAKWDREQMLKDAVEISYKGGTARINGEEKPFEGGTVRVIFLPKEGKP